MHPWIRRFLAGFSFRINYRALIYIGVCAVALLGAYVSNGAVRYVVLFGAGFYIAGLLAVWTYDRTRRF